ncbi:MAG: KTSC domain-containing protein [Myxococcales bacterium]|nr:KTSC domain-containing protein [Myxococcales bacterium]
MEKRLVQSSNLTAVGYDPKTQTLEVEFQHGGVYQYRNVPETVYDELLNSPSKGQFFYYNIRGAFPYYRVA